MTIMRHDEPDDPHRLTLQSSGYFDGPNPQGDYRARCLCGWVGNVHSGHHGPASRSALVEYEQHVRPVR